MAKPSIWNFLRDPESQRSVGNGLLDAANRGMVANSLGSLVDLSTNVANLGIAGAGYIGHKTGLLSQPPDLIDPRNVPGSSEWIGQKMQNAGIVSPNRNALAELGMGLLSPVAYKGAQKVGSTLYGIEQNALANLANPSTMRMQGQRGVVVGKWVDGYHGTTADFDPVNFETSRAGSSSHHDSADVPLMWTTRSPKIASMFASQNSVDATPISQFGSAGQGSSAIINIGIKDGGNVQPLKMKLNNPIVLRGSEAERMILGRASDDSRSSGEDFAKFAKAAIDAGHDGIIIKANPRGALEFRAEQYLLFEPRTQVKSKFDHQ